MKRKNDGKTDQAAADPATVWQALAAVGLIVAFEVEAASDPLDTWHQRPAVPANAFAYGNGTYVAVGENGQIWTSPDALGWTSRVSGTTNRLRDVEFGDGTFMAVGDYYTIVASTNAVDWVAKSSEAESPYVDVAYLKRKFVVMLREGGRTFIYEGGVQRSILNDAFLAEITYGDGFYLAVGESNVPEPASATVVVSTNLLSWDFFQPEFLSKGALYDVEYGNMIFVTRGDAGLYSSADGMRWTRSLQNLNTLNSITGLTYGGGIFLLTGSVGKLATSTDGQHWTVHDTGQTNGLGRGVFANHTFLLPSSNFFLQSDPVTTLQLTASSQPELSIDGPPDRVADIEFRDGLENTNTWQVADTITLSNPLTVWRDSNAMSQPRRFYRAILRP